MAAADTAFEFAALEVVRVCGRGCLVFWCVAVWCSVLQCAVFVYVGVVVALCCSVL